MALTHEDSLKNLIKDLCLIPGLSGYEDNVRHYLEDKLKLIDIKNYTDVLGNLICTLPGEKNLPSVMLFAHMDQLGFIVKKIEDDGFLRVENGFDYTGIVDWDPTCLSTRPGESCNEF